MHSLLLEPLYLMFPWPGMLVAQTAHSLMYSRTHHVLPSPGRLLWSPNH